MSKHPTRGRPSARVCVLQRPPACARGIVRAYARTRPRTRALAFDAHDLAQRVDDLDEVGLGRHDVVDRFVGAGRFIDHGGVLAALDALGRLGVVVERESPLGLAARHGAPRAVAARAKRLALALAAHDVTARAHRAGDDAELAPPGAPGGLAG